MPNLPVNGHVDIKLENCIGLPIIEGKDSLFYKLIRVRFNEEGKKEKVRPIAGFMKKY